VASTARRSALTRRRLTFVLAVAAIVAVVAVVVAVTAGRGHKQVPLPGIGRPAKAGDPFAYVSSREADFQARAIAGEAHVLFTASPGGAVATAARVARLRPLIDTASANSEIDPNQLEAIVFLESAGRPDAMAGNDPAAASGLTQILAQTGQSLLRMHIDLAASRRLTAQINRASGNDQGALATRLERRRAAVDDRFNPPKALAATVRYLQLAQRRFGRPDLAIESYHMGIGNLQHVLDLYDGGKPVSYTQLYFDTAPDHHAPAFNLLASFGDDSSLYYWRILGAAQIMRLYRSDRPALQRLASLQVASGSSAEVLHPPDRTPAFSDPNALFAAYAKHELVRLPSNARALGLAYGVGIGAEAKQLTVPAALYRGLRPDAVGLLVELAARVRTLSGGAQSLIVSSAVTDARYQDALGGPDRTATTGYSFTIARRYVNRSQAAAFQAMLDRLQSLNLIAWERFTAVIEVTVASDASHAIVNGP
jgi:soluble lytic murein transglycosylase-like protein